MGCATRIWGPFAWAFIHGLAMWLDKHKHDRKLAADVLGSFRYTMPCIYCRKSATGFMEDALLNPKLIGHKSGSKTYREWAYRMHERVNKKLFFQDAKSNPERLWSKWLGYQPKLSEVHYVSPARKVWLHLLMQYYAYVVCDYPNQDEPERLSAIQNMLMNIALLVQNVKLQSTINDFGLLPIGVDVNARLEYVHTLYKQMLPKFCCDDQNAFLVFCKSAIVGGCDGNKVDPTKVGCG